MSDIYIAAVEISSSKIIASIGKTAEEGQLTVLAIEKENNVEGVRYGIIQNLEETSVRVARLFNKLEHASGVSPRKIKSVFVGLSGRSLKSISVEVSQNLPDDTEITDRIISHLQEDAKKKAIDNTLEVVDAIPRIYRIGNTETHSPRGSIGNNIQATFDLIVCRPELKRNIIRTIPDKLGVKIEGFVITALAAGHLILTPDEKRLGCMLVDMGAETTTVTIYRKGCLCYLATLPMGGRNITKDITSLAVLEERAEQIKIASGNAMGTDASSSLNMNGLKLSDVNNLVVARAEEIVANVLEQIDYAGLKESDLTGGIICIGGASRLQGMMDLLAMQGDLPVRRGQLPQHIHLEDRGAANKNLIELISVLYAGATMSGQECLEMPVSEEVPATGTIPMPEEKPETIREHKQKKTNRIFKNFTDRLGEFFKSPDDDSELMD